MRAFRRIRWAETVIVNLVDSPTALRGHLVSSTGGALELANAELLTQGLEPQKLDGTQVVPLGRVDFVQRLGSA